MKYQMVLLAVAAMTFIPAKFADSQAPIRLDISCGVTLIEGVFINGNGPYRFILDTGSQSNQLDPQLASRLGIHTTQSFILNTPSGNSDVGGGQVRAVTLGPMQATNQEFLLTRLEGIRRNCPGVVGILGEEFLRKFDYLIDIRHRRLMLSDPPSSGTPAPVRMIHGRMAISTNLGDLVLDSGTDRMLLFRAPLGLPTSSLTTAEGSLMTISTGVDQVLQISGRAFRVGNAGYASVSGEDEAGLLPLTTFRAIYICNSKQYVVLNPKLPY